MIGVDIQIDEKAFTTFRKKLDTNEDIAQKAVGMVSAFFERTAKNNINESVYRSPKSKFYKRTSKARQSIIRQPLSKLKERVFGGVAYLKYLEFGTGIYRGRTGWWTRLSNLTGNLEDSNKSIYLKGMKPRPFWVPAIQETRREIPGIVDVVVTKHYNKR